jgi:hypothetical protein
MDFHETQFKRYACRSKRSVHLFLISTHDSRANFWGNDTKSVELKQQVQWHVSLTQICLKITYFVATYFDLSATHNEANCNKVSIQSNKRWCYILNDDFNFSIPLTYTTSMESIIFRLFVMYKSLHYFEIFVLRSEYLYTGNLNYVFLF